MFKTNFLGKTTTAFSSVFQVIREASCGGVESGPDGFWNGLPCCILVFSASPLHSELDLPSVARVPALCFHSDSSSSLSFWSPGGGGFLSSECYRTAFTTCQPGPWALQYGGSSLGPRILCCSPLLCPQMPLVEGFCHPHLPECVVLWGLLPLLKIQPWGLPFVFLVVTAVINSPTCGKN